MPRYKNLDWNVGNLDWNVGERDAQSRPTYDQIKVSLLLDIRDELQKLNALLHCTNFQRIPTKLDSIRAATNRIDKRLATKAPLK
jgi:hypothetical protein